MPYDAMPFETIPDLSTPTLRGLSYLLRHPELWPEGFEWSFLSCRKCAIGLGARIWEIDPYNIGMSAATGIPIGDLDELLVSAEWRISHRLFMRDIQLHHVADAIDRYLATGRD